jgi:hypothetical protein
MDWLTVLGAIDAVLGATKDTSRRRSRSLSSSSRQEATAGSGCIRRPRPRSQPPAGVGQAPAHPRFPATQELSGAAVAAREAVVVNDVTADPRYLTAFTITLSGGHHPGARPRHGCGVGTLDVGSGRRDAFTDADRQELERVAAATGALFAECLSPG